MQEKTLEHRGKPVHYIVSGDGPLVVLLHGFGEDARIWKEQFLDLAGYRLVVPYLPGSGPSPLQEDMTMEGLADVVLAVLQEESKESGKPVLIGHSMGGYIALAFAEKHEHLLSGFGLFHSTAYADSEEKKETRKKGIEFIEKNGAAAFLKTTIPNLYCELTKVQRPSLVEEHISSTNNFSGAALVSYYESMMKRKDRTAVLKKTKLPVLMILGKHDTAVPLKDGLEQTSMPDLSYIHVLQSSGHMGMVEEPQKANLISKQFLDDLNQKGQPE